MQGAARSIDLLRPEREHFALWLDSSIWSGLWQRRQSVSDLDYPQCLVGYKLPRPGCEAPFSRICQAVWLLTAQTICLSGSLSGIFLD